MAGLRRLTTTGMTDEDREQMRIGTINVREALDPSVKVTDAQIQEALWHYYYDVGKSVSYLKSTATLASFIERSLTISQTNSLLPSRSRNLSRRNRRRLPGSTRQQTLRERRSPLLLVSKL